MRVYTKQPSSVARQASVILREEAMLRSQVKHLEEEEERGRRERPRQQEPPRAAQEEREDDGDEPAQDDSDIR